MSFLLAVQHIRTPALDDFFSVATHLGDQLIVTAVLCAFLWWIDRPFAIKLAFVFFLGGMASQLLKLIWLEPRPWIADARLIPVAGAVEGATGWSFPSGHTAAAVALYGSLFLRYKRALARVLCALAIALVAFSRLYLGVHYPQDVIASLIVGTALLIVAWNGLHCPRRARWVLIASIALTAALAATFLLRSGQGHDFALTKDALTAVGASCGFLIAWRWMESRPLKVDGAIGRAGARAGGHVASCAIFVARMALGIAVMLALQWTARIHPALRLTGYAAISLWAVAIFPMLCDAVAQKSGQGGLAD